MTVIESLRTFCSHARPMFAPRSPQAGAAHIMELCEQDIAAWIDQLPDRPPSETSTLLLASSSDDAASEPSPKAVHATTVKDYLHLQDQLQYTPEPLCTPALLEEYRGKLNIAIPRSCLRCGATETPRWRCEKTLCNACGIRETKGPKDPDRKRKRNVPVPALQPLAPQQMVRRLK